ncbi:MAG: glycosyltransferase family 39 protein, partial [Pseudomonadota bacterium]
MDETWAAVSAAQPLLDALIIVMRFDLHPPLYYLQLSVWGIFGTGDNWLFANSILWSLFAIASLYWTVCRLHSERIGITAALFLLCLPFMAHYSIELRMYAMLAFLSVWVWYFNHVYPDRDDRWRTLLVVAGFETVMIYSHALGPFMLAFFLLYGFVRLFDCPFERIWRWIIVQGVVCISCLPVLANSLLRGASAAYPVPDATLFTDTLVFLIGLKPFTDALGSAGAWVGGALFIAFLGVAIYVKASRLFALTIIIPALLLGIIVSYAVKPIWVDRVFIFMAPFLSLVMALLVWHLVKPEKVAIGVTIGLAILLMISSVMTLSNATYPQNYRATAGYLSPQLKPSDRVYVPEYCDYWGMVWYLRGSDWSPLQVQGSMPAGRWQAILDSMSIEWKKRLKLEPETNALTHGENLLIIGRSPLNTVVHDGRLWVIMDQGDMRHLHVLTELAELGFNEVSKEVVGGLRLHLFEPPSEPAALATAS